MRLNALRANAYYKNCCDEIPAPRKPTVSNMPAEKGSSIIPSRWGQGYGAAPNCLSEASTLPPSFMAATIRRYGHQSKAVVLLIEVNPNAAGLQILRNAANALLERHARLLGHLLSEVLYGLTIVLGVELLRVGSRMSPNASSYPSVP
jgi:hypothetical protein